MLKRTLWAEAFPPGDFVREELEARGWTQGDLARIIGRPLQVVNQLINGRKQLTAPMAMALGEAFGTGPEFWINLEGLYRLWLVGKPDPAIARRAAAAARRTTGKAA